MKAMPDDIEDLMADPAAFGMPTFDEFVRNKKRYMGSKEDILESIDRGDPVLQCKQRYFVEHYEVKSLEQAQKLAEEMGFNLYKDFVLNPQLDRDNSGKIFSKVQFRSKRDLEKRMAW